jgi:hypothetical protein
MTERERRTRSGGTEDNVGDELDKAADRAIQAGTLRRRLSRKKKAQAA